MLRTLLRSKIHRVQVTGADLEYEGSITVDSDLLEAAELVPFERVEVYNITNGNRLATYVIPGVAGSGDVCINGAAAHLVHPGDLVIICCYSDYSEAELRGHVAKVVLVDERNRITSVAPKRE